MPESNYSVTTLEQAIFAGVPRASAHIFRSTDTVAQAYLAKRFPNMPAEEINRTIEFCRKARQAGIDLTAGEKPEVPVASGIFLQSERKFYYHVWQPIVLKDGKRAHGKTDVTAIWIQEP